MSKNYLVQAWLVIALAMTSYMSQAFRVRPLSRQLLTAALLAA